MTIITNSTPSVPSFDSLYAKMLPHFRYYAKWHTRRKGRRGDYEDVIQELAGLALEMYHSLVQRGKEVFYTPIMKYAIRRYQDGRRFMGSNKTDLLSHQTQILGRSSTCQLSVFEGNLDERDFMEDQRQPHVATAVHWKIDYETWLQRLTPRDQSIALDLSYGLTTGEVAKKYGVSDGLISQYRKRYADSWDTFIADKYKKA
jgi:RNA polymerase sigma factor (sigma-70 family)